MVPRRSHPRHGPRGRRRRRDARCLGEDARPGSHRSRRRHDGRAGWKVEERPPPGLSSHRVLYQRIGRQPRAVDRIQEETTFMNVHAVDLREIERMRDIYRHEMNCQIMFDSIHARPGWTHEYLITDGGGKVGYGSVAVAGPWQAKPTLYEYFVLPQHRRRVFDYFIALLTTTGAAEIETQSNG